MNAQNHNQLSCAKPSGTIFPASYNVNRLFFTILYSLCLTLSLISFIWNIDVLIKINTLLGIFAFILLSTRIRKEYILVYIYAGFLVVSFFASSFFVERAGWRLSNEQSRVY